MFAASAPGNAVAATAAHGCLGIGLVALVPWKKVVVRRAPRITVPSLILLVVVAICLIAGFVQVLAGFGQLAGLSPIQVHVGAAFALIPFVVWHLLRHRGHGPRRTDLSRRHLLRGAGLILIGGVGYAGVLSAAQLTRGLDRRPVATGSRRLAAADIPATIWLLDPVPSLTPEHRIDLAGRVITVADLQDTGESGRARTVRARLDCTSGWYAEATWTGRPLSDLLPAADLGAAASIIVTSVTGYTRRFPADEAADLWLVTRCEGRPLSVGTGAPVRLVAARRRGFWWVKWVASVQLSEVPAWRQLPFPPQ